MTPDAERPIGVFDSGVGGLTVVRELWRRLPWESILYFGDTARVPYGSKSPETVARYAREASAFLLSRGVKAVVVACNTVTAHAIDRLRDELPVPVVGVVEPGARAAARATRSGRIGVIGTAGTIASGAYDRALRRFLADVQIFAQPCPLLVPLVEEGWSDHPATRLIIEEYLRPLREVAVDVLILGCTHYPLLRPLLAEGMGTGATLVDSAIEAAADLERSLAEHDLLRRGETPPVHTFFASDSPIHFRELGNRFLGNVIERVERFDVDGYGLAA